jgi:hypothetical protein
MATSTAQEQAAAPATRTVYIWDSAIRHGTHGNMGRSAPSSAGVPAALMAGAVLQITTHNFYEGARFDLGARSISRRTNRMASSVCASPEPGSRMRMQMPAVSGGGFPVAFPGGLLVGSPAVSGRAPWRIPRRVVPGVGCPLPAFPGGSLGFPWALRGNAAKVNSANEFVVRLARCHRDEWEAHESLVDRFAPVGMPPGRRFRRRGFPRRCSWRWPVPVVEAGRPRRAWSATYPTVNQLQVIVMLERGAMFGRINIDPRCSH